MSINGLVYNALVFRLFKLMELQWAIYNATHALITYAKESDGRLGTTKAVHGPNQ